MEHHNRQREWPQTWEMLYLDDDKGGRKELKGHKGKKKSGEGETVKDEIIIQWNLPIKDTLEQGVLSFIERFPLFGG